MELSVSSDDTHDIVLAVQGVRRLVEDVAKLLKAARDRLDNFGWKPRSTAAITASTSLNFATSWIPQDAFLFVFNPTYSNHLAFLSVAFDSIDNAVAFRTPIACVGYIRFATPVGDNWSYRWSRSFDWVAPLYDGRFQAIPIDKLIPRSNIQAAEIAAVPLEAITNSELIEPDCSNRYSVGLLNPVATIRLSSLTAGYWRTPRPRLVDSRWCFNA
jgi:hypothetical protein